LFAGAAVLVLAGALGQSAEVTGIRLDAGVEIAHQGQDLADGELDYSTMVFQPYVQVSRFGTGPCFSGRIRGLFGIDEDTEIDDIECETSTSGWDVQGLFGFGLGLPGGIKIVPLAGLSFRGVTTESTEDGGSGSIDYDYSALILEVGGRVEISTIPKLKVIGQLTVGPVVTGEVDLDFDDLPGYEGDSVDIDFFDGYHLELRAGVDYKFTDMIAIHAGLVFERFADETQEFKDLDFESEDELNRVGINIGVAITF
jgi:hypothetical protein